jgi:hypothetical protein
MRNIFGSPNNDKANSAQAITMALVYLQESEIQRIFDSQGQNEVRSLYCAVKRNGKCA